MKAPSNPMGDRTFQAQGSDASFVRFQQRLAALNALKGRQAYWLKPEDAAKLSKTHDIMPHPDIDLNDLAS